ncbi:MAG: copper resistance protein CopC/CopD [Chloroflexi bacterium]|nr:copper resistance protein CopC/CopD [Chloroflexota bacterium]
MMPFCGKRPSLRIWLVLTFVALVSVIAPSPVSAHAYLARSDPAENAVLDTAPETMNLWFSEIISPKFSAAQLIDADGQAVDVNVRTDPSDRTRLIMDFPELADGVYTVRWKVLSEADGHFTQGLVIFGIGEGVDLGTAVAAETDTAVPWPEVVLRWLTFSLYMGLAGAVAVVYLVLNPASYPTAVAGALRTAQRRALILAWLSSWLALLTGVAWVVWQAILLTESLSEGASFLTLAWQWLSQTRLGLFWWAKQIILLLLTVGLGTLRQAYGPETADIANSRRPPNWLAPVIGLLLLALLLAQSLTSHAAALTPNTALAVVADALHLLAAGFWVGGLLALAFGLLPLARQNKANFTALVKAGWGPFGGAAALSVGLVLATGLYGTGREVASIDALISTLYGRALLSKVGLMLAAGALGALNSALLHPRLAAPLARLLRRPAGWTPLSLRRFPQLVMAEIGLGALVLLLAGLITAAPTAQGLAFAPTEDIPSSLSQNVDDMVIGLSVNPNKPGQNVFTVRANSTRKPPPAEVLRIILRFTYLDQDLGFVSVDAEEIEPGLYLIGGNQLNLAGKWQIDVVVRRKGIEDSAARFEWTVPQGGPVRPVIISNRPWEPALTLAAALLLLLILLGTAVIWRINRP